MNTDQLKLAVLINQEQSISKAAEKMFISQPTASNMLKTLEADLGYKVFTRNRSGVSLTDEGVKFIEYASNLAKGIDAIYHIRDDAQRKSLTVLSYRYAFAEEAFRKICERYANTDGSSDFKLQFISNTGEAMRMISDGAGDVAIALCRKSLLENYIRQASRRGIVVEELGEMQLELSCESDHPIISGDSIDFDKLGEYACFTSLTESGTSLYVSTLMEQYGQKIRKRISIGPSEARYEMMRNMNGYLISTPISDEDRSRYNLVSIPIEDSVISVFAVYTSFGDSNSIVREFINTIKKQGKKG